MTPEQIARVDAWLEQRIGWLRSNDYAAWLVVEWGAAKHQARQASTKPRIKAAHAASAGVLLALVREALGEPDLQARTTTEQMSPASRWVLWTRGGLVRLRNGARPDSEVEALVCGLEVAP